MTYLYLQKLKCPKCNRILGGKATTKKNGNTYFYYYCNDCKIEFKEKIINDYFSQFIDELTEYDSVVNQFFLPMIKQKFDEPKEQLEKEINEQKNKLERIKKAYINGVFELKEYNDEKKIVEKAINELELIGNEVFVKQINFRESICKPCQELFDKGYIDTTKPVIFGNVLGNIRFSNYLPEKEVGEIIMRLRQYYDVGYAEATYYVDKQVFYFNFKEDNSAIVRVFPLKDYYKLDPDNKMETYEFGIIYIREEDKFQMQEIDSAFDYIPDETNNSVIYTKEPSPISVSVKPVKFCEGDTEKLLQLKIFAMLQQSN